MFPDVDVDIRCIVNTKQLFASPYQVRTQAILSIDECIKLLEWCHANLDGELTNYINNGDLVWCFESERDAVLFALKYE